MIRVASSSRARRESSCGASCWACTTRSVSAAAGEHPADRAAADSDHLALAHLGDRRLVDRAAMAAAVDQRASRAIDLTIAIAVPSRHPRTSNRRSRPRLGHENGDVAQLRHTALIHLLVALAV